MLNLLVSLVAEYADFVTMLFGKLYLRVFLLILLTSLFFAPHMAKLTDETFHRCHRLFLVVHFE